MNVKLTKRKAWELISRIQPRLNIKQEATPSDVAIFKASTGPEGLEIRCENDWFNHNGRIKLTIGNVDGGTPTTTIPPLPTRLACGPALLSNPPQDYPGPIPPPQGGGFAG